MRTLSSIHKRLIIYICVYRYWVIVCVFGGHHENLNDLVSAYDRNYPLNSPKATSVAFDEATILNT
jgi:hypothetical protein